MPVIPKFMRLQRLQFQLTAWIVLALSLPTLVGHAASKSADNKPPIPSDLFFEAKPLADEENAIHLWRRAAKDAVLRIPTRIK